MNDRRQMKLTEMGDNFAEQTKDSAAIVCPTCGKDNFDTKHGLKIHHTTVHDDRSLTLKERVEFECERCGSTKQLPPDEAERRRFCTDQCKNKWQSEAYRDEGGPGWDGGKATAVCSYCGATEKRFPSHINEINFCSDSCEADWKSENRAGKANPNYSQLSADCAWCDAELSRPRWRVKKYEYQFCDKGCKGAYYSANPSELHEKERVTVTCSSCGEDKKVIPAQATRSEHHFCDRECKGEWWSNNVSGESHPNWKDGYEPYYGPNWERKRQETRERDGYKCILCGITDGASKLIHGRELSVHHVIRINDFETPAEANDLGNLLTVCTYCHQRVFE
jgi:5-methylcytosine-specific restriction endonuclease McrA